MAKCFPPGVPSLLCRVHLANGEVLPVWMASVQQFVDELEQKVLELLGLGDDTGEEAETTALLGLAHVKGKDVQWLKRGVRMQDFGIPLTKCHKNVAPGDDALPLQMDLHLLIKFVPPSVCSLAEPVVALLFFHHARMQFFKGQIHLAIEQYIRCWVCLLLLSETNMAPMDNNDSNIVELLPPPPVPLLRHFQLGLDDVQQMVHDQFRTVRAQQSDPMEMLVEFLQLCASAPLFGCSFFSVRDKSGNDWSLALNGRAMAQLDPLDPYRPKRVWDWNSVGNFHRNGETEFVLEMLSTNKVARHASLVYPLGKQPSPSLPSCHSPPALSQWTAASTSLPRAPHRLCFRCEHPRQCQSLWEFAVAQHRWHLHSNCREMGTKLHFTQNSEAVRRQLVARLRKHFLPSTEEDALSLASIGAKFTPSLLSAATSSSSIASSSSSFSSSLSLPFPSSSSSSSSFPLLLHFPCRMPAARVADRSPMAHLPMRESARSQQQHHHQTKEPLPEEEVEPKQQQQQQQKNMNAAKSEEECRRENEICTRLMELRERLEEQLITRLEELKGICVVEGDLTGQLPKEIYKCLLPDEMEPTVKRRVGTTFKFPQEVLTIRRQNDDNDNGNDEPDEDRQLSQLSAEIELNRRIVAAAERLAKDKSANKSVRKKRRKDLQAAAQRLRSLEKGLHRMRLSSSKPDVSSMAMADGTAAASAASIGRQSGSGFSLNSLKAWPNFYHTLRMSNNTKSCPATPRGSVPDLSMTNAAAVAPAAADNVNGASDNCRRTTPSTAKKLHKMLSRDHLISVVSVSISQHSEVPSSSSSSSLSGHPSSSSGISSAAPSLSSSSNLLIMAPPPVPSRRSSSGSSISAGGRPTPPHHRRGGTPTTKNSSPTESDRTEAAVRQQQQQQSACGNHLYANIGYQSSSPYKSAYRQCQFPTMHQQMSPPPLSGHRQPPMTSSTSFSALKDVASCRPCTSSSASSLLAAAASTQLGQIVRRLDAAHPLRVPLIVGRAGGVQSGQAHSTGSLDRRLRRVPTTTTMKLASSTTSASAICPPAFHQLPPPPLPRTTAIEELVERDQLLVTTFPAVSDRCDNGTIIQLLKASSDFARFRSISAVLDKSARGDCSEMHFPRPNDRMEALLASIHRQSRVGSIASDISTNSATPNNDGGGTTTTTTLV